MGFFTIFVLDIFGKIYLVYYGSIVCAKRLPDLGIENKIDDPCSNPILLRSLSHKFTLESHESIFSFPNYGLDSGVNRWIAVGLVVGYL